MVKFPGPEEAPQPGSLRPPGVAPVDRSYQAIVSGAQDLAQGLGVAGDAAYGVYKQQQKEQNTADISAAEARLSKGYIDIGNEYEERNDYENFGEAQGQLDDLRDEAAALIRDPKMREAWTGEANLKSLQFMDGIHDKARDGIKAANFTRLETSLETNYSIISDPTAPPALREKAMLDAQGSLIRGLDTNLLTTDQASALKKKFLDGAEEDYALNLGLLMLNSDPTLVATMTGIPAALGGGELSTAAAGTGVDLFADNPVLAQAVATEIGDTAFPTDPKLQAAYLSDPENAKRYSAKALDLLTTKYGGDVEAALIAIHPDGGDKLARAWQKGLHDDQLLPVSVRHFYHETLAKVKGVADTNHIAPEAEPGVEIGNIDANTLARFEQAQSAFGEKLLIVGGKRETLARGEGGLDVDVSKLSDEDKVRFIETASAMGFTGIGVDDKVIHLDLNKRQFTGVDGKEPPKWAEDVGVKHTGGQIVEVPLKFGKVDPAFAKLPFAKRLALYEKAQAEVDRQSVEMRGGIEIAETNAPVAMMNQGKYDGYQPTAADYVKAYGADTGLQKWEAFSSAMEVAETAHGFQTKSLAEIAEIVDAAKPTSTGPGAYYEQKRYDAYTEAAAAIKTAREKDPAGYTMQAFPNIEALMQDFGKSPEATQAALTAMDAAQTKLGIEQKALMPKVVVDKALQTFNNPELPVETRIGGIVGTLFATTSEDQQKSMLIQFIKAGLPPSTNMVMKAYERGDEAGARYLIAALTLDPKTKLNLPVKDTEIDMAVANTLQSPLVSAYYGLNGTFTNPNAERAQSDSTLLKADIQLRMAQSHMTLDQATAAATRDMFGGIKPLIGGSGSDRAGMYLTVPEDTDQQEMEHGFSVLLPQVAAAIKDKTDPVIARGSPGEQAVNAFVRDTDTRSILREGYFVNAGTNKYQFLTPDGMAIEDAKTGKPLVWELDDVLAAAASVPRRGPPSYQSTEGSAASSYNDYLLGK